MWCYSWESSQNSNGGSFQFVTPLPGRVHHPPSLQVIGAKGIQPQTWRFLGPDPNLVDDLRNPRSQVSCQVSCQVGPGWMKSPIVLLLELPWLEETPIVFVGKNSNSELLHAGEILVFPLRLLLNTLNSRCKTCLNSHSCLVKTLVASPCFHQKISPKHRRRTDRRHVVHATSKCGGEHSNTLGEGDDDHSH